MKHVSATSEGASPMIKSFLSRAVKLLSTGLAAGLTSVGVLSGDKAHPGPFTDTERRDRYRP